MVVRILLIALMAVGVSLAQAKLACIDTNRILQESKLVASAQGELRSKLAEYQGKLSEKEKKLEELKKQIESKAISQKAKEQKIKEYQRIEAEWRELQEKAQRELAEMKQRLENMVYNRVKEAAEKLAKDKGLAGVIDCSVFIYRDPDMDITTEVIRMIDEPQR
jgi:outer membrane protein